MIGAALLAGPTELFAPKDEIVCKVMSEVALTKILPDEEDELTAAVVTMVPLTPLVIVPVVAVNVTVAELYAAKDWMILLLFLKYSKPSA